jgi:hypothetical protein
MVNLPNQYKNSKANKTIPLPDFTKNQSTILHSQNTEFLKLAFGTLFYKWEMYFCLLSPYGFNLDINISKAKFFQEDQLRNSLWVMVTSPDTYWFSKHC